MTKKGFTFDKDLGVKPVTIKKGYCLVKLNLKPQLLNHGGIVHGGVIASLCDIALAGAVGSVLKKEEWCVTAELNIEFVNPAFPDEPIFGYGKLVKKGNTLAFVDGGVKSRSKKLIAKAQGIWVIKTKPSRKILPAKTLS